jgi:hypothetical protein
VPGYDSKPRFIPEGVTVRELGSDKGRKKERYAVVDTSLPMPGIVFTHNNSADNILRGLGERLYMVPTDTGFARPPRPVVFDCGDYVERVVRKMPKFTEPITSEEFVQLYNGPKRRRYEAAAENVLSRGGITEKDARISLFIKDEKVLSWNKVDPAPRLISPRSPEYCLELGRFIKPIEHLLYKAVARVWGEVTIYKGLNFNERGEGLRQKWESFDDPVAIGLDASRFDQHVSVEALKWEHSIYKGCYVGPQKYLQWLLDQQLVNQGECFVDDKHIAYSVEGGRMSGDMNTALGNCLIMTAIVWHYLKSLGVQGKLANDGDDCVLFLEREDLEVVMKDLPQFFRERGFTMKVEKPVYTFEEIEFCQCHPVWNGEQWTMCRNLPKVLFCDAAHVGRSEDEIAIIRHATSTAGLVWAKGIPVIPSFYRCLGRSGKIARNRKERTLQEFLMRNSGTYWHSRGCDSGTQEVTNEARLSFYRAFGVSPSEQVALEDYYTSLQPGNAVLSTKEVIIYQPEIPSSEYPLYIEEGLEQVVFNR